MKLALLMFVVACSSEKKDNDKADKLDLNDIKTESAVEFAEKSLPELDQKLASSDPGSASSTCAVIKPDLARIEKAKPELAATIRTKCGRDLAVRSLAVEVDKIEKDPHECAMLGSYLTPVAKAKAQNDPEVVKLGARVDAACKK